MSKCKIESGSIKPCAGLTELAGKKLGDQVIGEIARWKRIDTETGHSKDIIELCVDDDYYITFNFCPMCGEKLGEI